jgi:hypothetical protein
MKFTNARPTQKPLDQVGTKESARCALCKFFFVRKLFAQPNSSCHVGQEKADAKGVEYIEYNPSFNRQNNKFDNQPEKAFAYSMFKNGMTSGREMARQVNNVCGSTLKRTHDWLNKFNAEDPKTKISTFDHAALKNCITVKKRSKLSEDSINALLKYEFSRNQTAKAAATRINQLFGADIVEVSF